MREAFDVFLDGDDLLEVLVLAVGKDGVVDYYAVDFGVVVRVNESVLEEFAVDFSELESEATGTSISTIPL